MATVVPGTDDTHPDLIQITSFNEWFEGHQIEPSRTYGDRYLQITRQESDAYRAAMGAPAEVSPVATGTAPSSAAGPAAALASPPASSSGCRFVLGFATIASALPQQVGQCQDEEGHNPANGDALQHATGGLLVWRKADNWTAFTDGYHSWINGPKGIVERLNTQRFSWEANPDGLPVVS